MRDKRKKKKSIEGSHGISYKDISVRNVLPVQSFRAKKHNEETHLQRPDIEPASMNPQELFLNKSALEIVFEAQVFASESVLEQSRTDKRQLESFFHETISLYIQSAFDPPYLLSRYAIWAGSSVSGQSKCCPFF
jgi:hypothetical protein